MIQINNAEKFKKLFGMYATELWSAQEKDFLQWLNMEYVPDTNVGELINRQDAIDAVETKIKKWNAVDGEGYHVGLGLRYTDVIDTLTELPSVQPEIIRCKGCKHHHKDRDGCAYCDRIDYGYGWREDDYCSFAELRGDSDGREKI